MTSLAEPAGSEYFDQSEFAQREALEESHYWHLHRRQVLLRELSALVPGDSCGPLLEIGCGIGTVATFLNENGYRVDYADYFNGALEIAERRARARLGARVDERSFKQVDVTAPLTLDHSYTGILLLDVIEHLPDDASVLANVYAALDTGGWVVVTVPAFDFLWSPWDDVEKHKRRYTLESLERVLSGAGFEVARSTYFFGALFFASLGMKALRAVRKATSGSRPTLEMIELTEAKNVEVLNRLMLGALAPERTWLPKRSLPFGTSALAIARKR